MNGGFASINIRRKPKIFKVKQAVSSGDHRVFESEIFWKARGDHLQISKASIACVFQKISEANARW
jgi:hypothetical protein